MSLLQNTIFIAIALGLLLSVALTVTRTPEDANKKFGAYMLKVMIVMCPIIYLVLMFINANNASPIKLGGSMDMRTGMPDF
jgi:hypothetical protein